MALQTNFSAGPVLEITRFPATWMRTDLAGAVAFDTDVTIRVTGLAGLEVPTCFGCVLRSPVGSCVRLVIGTCRVVRFDLQRPFRETAVAGVAVFLIVAADALLLVVLCLYRVDADKIAAMALWM